MEAYWTRFMPWCRKLREVLASGELGTIHHVTCDFSIQFDPAEAKRLFDPALCGGSLLDVGIYPVSIASMIFGGGAPQQIVAVGDLLDTGVDGHIATTLRYGKNATAQLFCGALADGPSILSIIASKGRVTVHDDETGYWHCSPGLTVSLKNEDGRYHTEEFRFPKPQYKGHRHSGAAQQPRAAPPPSPAPPHPTHLSDPALPLPLLCDVLCAQALQLQEQRAAVLRGA